MQTTLPISAVPPSASTASTAATRGAHRRGAVVYQEPCFRGVGGRPHRQTCLRVAGVTPPCARWAAKGSSHERRHGEGRGIPGGNGSTQAWVALLCVTSFSCRPAPHAPVTAPHAPDCMEGCMLLSLFRLPVARGCGEESLSNTKFSYGRDQLHGRVSPI